jgi:hypothetical protein
VSILKKLGVNACVIYCYYHCFFWADVTPTTAMVMGTGIPPTVMGTPLIPYHMVVRHRIKLSSLIMAAYHQLTAVRHLHMVVPPRMIPATAEHPTNQGRATDDHSENHPLKEAIMRRIILAAALVLLVPVAYAQTSTGNMGGVTNQPTRTTTPRSGQMAAQPGGENCGTPEEPKGCPPMPRHPLPYYPANKQ